jgi:hypothetical protein
MTLQGELLPAMEFGERLHPAGMRNYNDVRETISGLPNRISKSASASVIFIDCPNDLGSTVSAALSKSFSSHGFPVTLDRRKANYICTAKVVENVQTLEAGIFYTPSITATITGKNGEIFTYDASIQKTGASRPEVAKQRAYTAIAKEINNSFDQKFINNFKK